MFFHGEHVLQSDLFSNPIKLTVSRRKAALQRFNIMLQILYSKPYVSQCSDAGQGGGEEKKIKPSFLIHTLGGR